ncbi:VOC family protein [Lentzea nigeriaca]|uniref:VOC family protein n=1 Tax=Lentzea nigeriaca TaxID=1128665 RepID=UPI00195D53F7|nr:VOC family protein [Lentzea nigeriaca]MBM7860617.1 putative enzyme related to lactoylglutathione lyase [Lentzea nigeriaca]
MITHAHSCTINVRDLDEALSFYVDVLGWEKRQDTSEAGMRWLTVAPPGAQTAFALSLNDTPNVSFTTGCGISLITDDIDGDCAAFQEKGVRVKTAPDTMPWGDRATWFSDPFGNEFFLVQPGS